MQCRYVLRHLFRIDRIVVDAGIIPLTRYNSPTLGLRHILAIKTAVYQHQATTARNPVAQCFDLVEVESDPQLTDHNKGVDGLAALLEQSLRRLTPAHDFVT